MQLVIILLPQSNQINIDFQIIDLFILINRELSQNSDFSNTPFVKEEGYKGCYKVEHVLSV